MELGNEAFQKFYTTNTKQINQQYTRIQVTQSDREAEMGMGTRSSVDTDDVLLAKRHAWLRSPTLDASLDIIGKTCFSWNLESVWWLWSPFCIGL